MATSRRTGWDLTEEKESRPDEITEVLPFDSDEPESKIYKEYERYISKPDHEKDRSEVLKPWEPRPAHMDVQNDVVEPTEVDGFYFADRNFGTREKAETKEKERKNEDSTSSSAESESDGEHDANRAAATADLFWHRSGLMSVLEQVEMCPEVPACRVAPSGLCQCLIVRGKGLLSNSFRLYYQKDMRPMLSAVQQNSRTPNYHIFDVSRTDDLVRRKKAKERGVYVGKLRANRTCTEYVMYDDGLAPEKARSGSMVRRELASVIYERPSFFQALKKGGQPRSIKLLVPMEGSHLQGGEEDTIILNYHRKRYRGLAMLQSRAPKMIDGAFRLNFGGRVRTASIKNIQLSPPDHPDMPLLQFGKLCKDKFSLDFRPPITPMQAFALAIAQCLS